MGIEILPQKITDRYQIDERRHACAILANDFPDEYSELITCLSSFDLLRSEIMVGGGRKSKIAERFDGYLMSNGWEEKSTDIQMVVDGNARNFETHKVDLCKNRIAIEVEWNNKAPFFSRDLNTFRLLHELNVISVGIIITRSDELQPLFAGLGHDSTGKPVARKYGASTTHWSKLMPRIESGGGGACPILSLGILPSCYFDDSPV